MLSFLHATSLHNRFTALLKVTNYLEGHRICGTQNVLPWNHYNTKVDEQISQKEKAKVVNHAHCTLLGPDLGLEPNLNY